MSVSFKCIFSGEDNLWFFLQKGNIIFVTFIHIYKKYHISMYFLRNIISNFPSKEKNVIFSGKKVPSFQIIQERSYSSAISFGKTIFLGDLKKISNLHVFFWEKSSFIFRIKIKIIFPGKRNIIFPNNATEKIIFQCYFFRKTIFSEHLKKVSYLHVFCLRKIIFHFPSKNKMMLSRKRNIIFLDNTRKIISQDEFLERPSFQSIWKKKIWFFAQWYLWWLLCLSLSLPMLVSNSIITFLPSTTLVIIFSKHNSLCFQQPIPHVAIL